jgi:hypothetical protein
MNHTSQIDELLDQFEVQRDQGRELSVEQLCADYPESSANEFRHSLRWTGCLASRRPTPNGCIPVLRFGFVCLCGCL